MVAGIKNACKWDYSEYSDILNVHRRTKRVVGSAELGDFTIDFGKDGSIAGVEVANAVDFFTMVGIGQRQLARLRGAEFMVQQSRGMRLVFLKLYFGDGKARIVPMPAPVMARPAAA